jgi:transcriptional regulator with XRE-family HTH domain
MSRETFGKRVKRLREESGTSIASLALEVGISEGSIRQIETGAVKSPSFMVGLRLARYLDVDPYYLALGETSSVIERLTTVEKRLARLEQRVGNEPP